jgi:hypothetical protein
MNFRYLSTLCLLWTATLGLLGCGGGGGTGDSNQGGTTTTVQPGLYYASVNSQDFWGVISPDNGGSNRWYGLHYATTNPNIYSGDLTGSGTPLALVRALQYENTVNTLLSGSASLTSSGAGQLSGNLSLITSPSIQPVAFNASTPSGFTYNQAAKWSDISGNWTGQLSFGAGESSNFPITIAANSGMVTAGRRFAYCQWNPSNSVAAPRTDVNIFALALHMEEASLCTTNLDGQTLTGVAFVTPIAGNRQRLIWVATTTDGHAISFKADR